GSKSKRPQGTPQTRIRDVLVLADADKKDVRRLLSVLEPWLAARVAKVAVEPDARTYYRRLEEGRGAKTGGLPDLLVVLGGGGALLGAVRAFRASPVPTIGINFGRVGFLASAEAGHWEQALEEVLEGRTVVEPRLRLEAEFVAQGGTVVRGAALNDVVLT